MNDKIDKPRDAKTKSSEPISPANEKPFKKPNVDSKPQSKKPVVKGVSAPGVVFLSLLTSLVIITGLFAFRAPLTKFTSPYITQNQLANQNTSFNAAQTPPAGFVTVPAASDLPTLSAAKTTDTETNLRKEIADLKMEQQTLDTKIEALKATPTNNDAGFDNYQYDSALAATKAELKASQARIAILEAQSTEMKNAFENALAKINANQSQSSNVKGLIAFQALQVQALSGQPFESELEQVITILRSKGASTVEVSQLNEVAKTGRTSLITLKQHFAKAVTDYMQLPSDSEAGIVDKVAQNLSSFVRVRRTDGMENDDDSIIAKAEELINEGNVQAALTTISTLSKPARKSFDTFMKEAKLYTEVPNMLRAIQLQFADNSNQNENIQQN